MKSEENFNLLICLIHFLYVTCLFLEGLEISKLIKALSWGWDGKGEAQCSIYNAGFEERKKGRKKIEEEERNNSTYNFAVQVKKLV